MTGSEPNVTVELEGQAPVIYQKMDPEKAALVFENHVLNGEIQQEYTIEIPAQEAGA
jgi:(2Fe-2S) ferredoxin